MADYPTALPVLTDEVGGATDPLSTPSLPDWALHISQEVEAIAAELGLSPSDSYATVKARLDAIAGDAELAAIAGLTSAADRLPYFTGSGTAALATFTAAGRALVDDADATAQRATLGLVIGSDVAAFLITANRQTGSYTLVLADAGKAVEQNVGSANNLTVPPNSSVAFAVGTVLEVFQYGAGQTTIVAGAGVTLRSPGGKLKLVGQYSQAALRKIATDEWAVAGDLTT